MILRVFFFTHISLVFILCPCTLQLTVVSGLTTVLVTEEVILTCTDIQQSLRVGKNLID